MSVHEWEREREGRTGKKSSTIHRRRQHGAPGARWWKIPHVTDWLIDNQWQREGEPGWRGGETGTAGSNMREKTTKGEKAPSRKYENEAADGRFEGRIQVWLHTYQLLMCFHQCHNSRGGGSLFIPNLQQKARGGKQGCVSQTLDFPTRYEEVVPQLKENHANLQLGPKEGHEITFLLVSGELSVPTCCLECDITWEWEIKHRGVEHWMELLNKLDYGEYSLEFESKYRR